MITAILLPEGAGEPSLVELDPHDIKTYYQHIHGGYMEALNPPGATMYLLDDISRHQDRVPNFWATTIAEQLGASMYGGCIYGNALLVGAPDDDGDDTDLPEQIINVYVKQDQRT